MTTLTLPYPADERDRHEYFIRMTRTRSTITWLIRHILIHAVMRIESSGVENLPEFGPAILAGNHVTNFDVFPMQLSLPRPIFFMGKAELFRQPIIGWFYRRLGAFPVKRGEGDTWALRQAARVLETGETLGMFPEGKRNKGRGLLPGKSGTARLALETGAPIVPIAVTGTHQLFKHLYCPTRVTVTLGRPIHPGPGCTPESLTQEVMHAIAALLPQEYRGAYNRVEAPPQC